MAQMETVRMIRDLNAAEEIMAALDQFGGSTTTLERQFGRCYDTIKMLRDEEAGEWNADVLANPGVDSLIYRCSEAEKPYHTDADGPCEVWSTDQVCSLHVQRAEDQMAKVHENQAERADYFRRKNHGEDI